MRGIASLNIHRKTTGAILPKIISVGSLAEYDVKCTMDHL